MSDEIRGSKYIFYFSDDMMSNGKWEASDKGVKITDKDGLVINRYSVREGSTNIGNINNKVGSFGCSSNVGKCIEDRKSVV